MTKQLVRQSQSAVNNTIQLKDQIMKKTTKKNKSVKVVNVLQTELIETHYVAISSSMKTTAAAILHTAQCVYNAKQALNKTSYKALAAKFHKSELSKSLKIGDRATTMIPHIMSLPASSVAIYHLSRLEQDKFDQYVETKQINPQMTTKDAAKLLSVTPSSSAETLISVIVRLDDKTRNAQHEYADKMKRYINDLKTAAKNIALLDATVKIHEAPVAQQSAVAA